MVEKTLNFKKRSPKMSEYLSSEALHLQKQWMETYIYGSSIDTHLYLSDKELFETEMFSEKGPSLTKLSYFEASLCAYIVYEATMRTSETRRYFINCFQRFLDKEDEFLSEIPAALKEQGDGTLNRLEFIYWLSSIAIASSGGNSTIMNGLKKIIQRAEGKTGKNEKPLLDLTKVVMIQNFEGFGIPLTLKHSFQFWNHSHNTSHLSPYCLLRVSEFFKKKQDNFFRKKDELTAFPRRKTILSYYFSLSYYHAAYGKSINIHDVQQIISNTLAYECFNLRISDSNKKYNFFNLFNELLPNIDEESINVCLWKIRDFILKFEGDSLATLELQYIFCVLYAFMQEKLDHSEMEKDLIPFEFSAKRIENYFLHYYYAQKELSGKNGKMRIRALSTDWHHSHCAFNDFNDFFTKNPEKESLLKAFMESFYFLAERGKSETYRKNKNSFLIENVDKEKEAFNISWNEMTCYEFLFKLSEDEKNSYTSAFKKLIFEQDVEQVPMNEEEYYEYFDDLFRPEKKEKEEPKKIQEAKIILASEKSITETKVFIQEREGTEYHKNLNLVFNRVLKNKPQHLPNISRPLAVIDENMILKKTFLLHAFPHFEEVIEFIFDQMHLYALGDQSIYIPPILLNGPAGTGKTFFFSTLSEILKTDMKLINVPYLNSSWAITGLEPSWGNACPGFLFDFMLESRNANPLIILDEIDKIKSSEKGEASIENVMLSLFERHSSKTFKDAFLPTLEMDTSHVLWVATSNNYQAISDPLLSRMKVFQIPMPSKQELKCLAMNIYNSLRNSNDWGSHFDEKLPEATLERLVMDEGSVRDMRKIIEFSFAKAAKEGGNTILTHHLSLPETRTNPMPWHRPLS